ncbi:hypothetical protein [Herbiconiux liukaitaii]|uniref:hypothetical protein n=1 Tax=Herbiconiux liukaitaii TaxID=3342799 RepID=UPI0035B86AB5
MTTGTAPPSTLGVDAAELESEVTVVSEVAVGSEAFAVAAGPIDAAAFAAGESACAVAGATDAPTSATTAPTTSAARRTARTALRFDALLVDALRFGAVWAGAVWIGAVRPRGGVRWWCNTWASRAFDRAIRLGAGDSAARSASS